MVQRTKHNTETTRLMDIDDLKAYTNLGTNRACELAQEAEARIRYGKRVLFDRVKLDAYIEKMTD